MQAKKLHVVPQQGPKENPTVRALLRIFGHVEAGGVTEVSVFSGNSKGPSHTGYYADTEKASGAIESFDGQGNIYVTLNPVKKSLLGRYNNRMAKGSFQNRIERTEDDDIHSDSWLLIDVDPKRPSGISSTAEEKAEALRVTQSVYDWLIEIGVPKSSTILGDSGNGYYILIHLPDYPNIEEMKSVKKNFINFIGDKFDNPQVEIDRKVYNPARLCCALGTLKRKGENLPDRPHRRSRILSIGGEDFDPTKALPKNNLTILH
jgi:hypothetical protein